MDREGRAGGLTRPARTLALAAACSAAAVAGGCGSSSSSNSSTSSPTPSTAGATQPAPTTSQPAPTTSQPAKSTSPPPKTKSPGTTKTAPVVSPPASLVRIAYRNTAIAPAKVTITAGTNVTWTDFDESAIQHNVAAQGGPQRFTSPTLTKGSTFSFKFTKPGVYNYICTFHPTQMIGKITVVP